MSYKYYFFDDQEIGAAALNRLVKMFTTGGVADNFSDGVPYSLSKLNDTVISNATSGIVPANNNTLKVSCDAGFVYIEPGVAFFDDGTVIEIESREQLDAIPDTVSYVYLKSDAMENKAYPVVSTTPPDEYNTVELAVINADGTVTDKRHFAKGRVPSFYASDAGLRIERSFDVDEENNNFLNNEMRIPLSISGNSLRFIAVTITCPMPDGSEPYKWVSHAFYDVETNTSYTFTLHHVLRYEEVDSTVKTGTDFNIARFKMGVATYRIVGRVYIDNDKVELGIEGIPSNTTNKDYYSKVFPAKVNIIAC